jgi:integrase
VSWLCPGRSSTGYFRRGPLHPSATRSAIEAQRVANRKLEDISPAQIAAFLADERVDGHFFGIQRPWQRVRGVAGLDDVRIHDLRHSFASIAVSGGDSLYLVGKVLGHRQSRASSADRGAIS